MKWLRSWWEQIKQHRVAIVVVGIVLMVVIALVFAVVWFNGTGFDGYKQVTTAHTISGPSAGTIVKTEVDQPGKALWDWLQLLIIPVALAVGVWWLNRLQQERDQKLADERARIEREVAEQHAKDEQEVATDNQHEAALQDYVDNMSELLFHEKLRESDEHDEVRTIAHVRTLNVLSRLDGRRKGIVVQFLHEFGLIYKQIKYIDLSQADLTGAYLVIAYLRDASLSGANLQGADLFDANLQGADLKRAHLRAANLSRTNLSGADLSYANLNFARLSGADLRGANLRGAFAITNEELEKEALSLEGATMPDGTIHA